MVYALHEYVSTIDPTDDPNIISSEHWNQEQPLYAESGSVLFGRYSATAGLAQEITLANSARIVLSFVDNSLQADIQLASLGPTYFTSANISQWTNDAGYLTAANVVNGIADGAVLFAASNAISSDSANFHYDDITNLLTLGGDLTLSNATGTITANAIKGDATNGFYIKAANGTNVGNLGAGNTANATWYGSHNFDSVTASRLASFGASKTLSSVANLTSWIAGTTNRIIVTDDGDGTVTLNTPQDIHTSADVAFSRLTVGTLGIEYTPGSDVNVNMLTVNVTGTPRLRWDESADAFSINKGLIVTTTAGFDVTPGSDTNTDLITLNVTGTPTLSWNESADALSINKGLIAAGTFGFDCNPGSDVDTDLLTVGVTGSPRLYWDESEDCIRDTHGLIVDTYIGVRRTPNTNFPLTLQAFSGSNDMIAMYDSSGNQQWHTGLGAAGTGLYIVESGIADRMYFKPGGGVAIYTSSTTGLEVIELNQADSDQPFIDFIGTSGSSTTTSISTAVLGTYRGKIWIEINGTKRYIPFYD
jgi:hypothetical protein